MNWIKVEDDLPPLNITVLALDYAGKPKITRRQKNWNVFWGINEGCMKDNPFCHKKWTHWTYISAPKK